MLGPKQLKVCFVGVGSIASRHIKNLRNLCVKKGIDITVDAFRRNVPSVYTDYNIDHIYYEIEAVPSDYDVIFITNPTHLHMDALSKFHNKGKHFYIEKPMTSFDDIEGIKAFNYRKGSIYYIACPLRYMAVMQYIKNNIDWEKVISVRSICSSYLPDWRPGTDYRECYSAHKDMGGGVSIDLIHEWDYIESLMGMPREVKSIMGKKSSLEIDSEDYAIYVADYEHATVELHLDYYGRSSIREMLVMTDADTIRIDLLSKTVTYLNQETVLHFDEDRDVYCERELEHFLEMISGNQENDNTPIMAYNVMKLTQGVVER